MFETIKNNAVYKEVLKDSFGGIMYNVANEGKYNTDELKTLVEGLEFGTSGMDGIMKGALQFLKIF